jgi:tetratricopeptide (TPR) repeat protein
MNVQQDKAKSIFVNALEIASAPARRAYVEAQCGTDEALRREVQDLLQCHERMGAFLNPPTPAPAATVDDPISERPGTVIGPYKLLEQIGEGGFGVVFLAEQQEPIRRKVALKILKPGMDTRQVIARFEAERQALAIMDHPSIAKVLDGGQTSSGRPYFVMDLVKGLPITDYCDQNQLTPRERLELFVCVCQAVQHAHQKGIIHRDIKPSNVLVTLHEGTPLVKIIDFGIAKALGQQLTDKTLFTGLAQMIGTPLYMSPEQAAPSNVDVDTRSDIYSLGVLLYELLTGTTPFDKERFKEAGYDEMRRIIREEEPPRPSRRISTLGQAATSISTQRKSDPRRLSQLLRGELDWIVMKALDKERNRRYEAASAFAADVQRYLSDEPVQACPPSTWYWFRKFARRNRVALAVTGLVLGFLVLLGGTVGWVVKDRWARRAALEQELSQAMAEARKHQDKEEWTEAAAAARRAAALFVSSGEPVPRAVEQMLNDLEVLVKVEAARLEQAASVRSYYFDSQAAAPLYSAAFEAYGLPVLKLEPEECAERIAASASAPQLVAALDDWAQSVPDPATKARLSALAALADRDPLGLQIRAAMVRKDRAELLRLSQQPEILDKPATTLQLLALSLYRVGFLDAAVSLLRRAEQRRPADFWINHQLAFALMLMKPPRAAEAVGYYRAALVVRPKSPGVLLNLGNALSDAGYKDEAVTAYRKAIRLRADYVSAHVNLAKELRDNKQRDEAMAESEEAVRLAPASGFAHFSLAESLNAKGRADEAMIEYREAIRLQPRYARHHFGLGLALYNRQQFDEAIDQFREARQLKPNDPDHHNMLGAALYAKHRLDEAVVELKAAVRLERNRALFHYNLGNALGDLHQTQDAIAEYREALQLDPDYAAARTNLGNVLVSNEQADEAIEEFQRALRSKKDFPEAYKAHIGLGGAWAVKGQPDKALAAWRKSIELHPDNAQAHINIGHLLGNQGSSDEAIAEYRKAIAIDPKNALAHCYLALVLRKRNRLDEAIAEFQKATKLILQRNVGL